MRIEWVVQHQTLFDGLLAATWLLAARLIWAVRPSAALRREINLRANARLLGGAPPATQTTDTTEE